MRHARLQHERFATVEPKCFGARLDDQLASKAVNHDVSGGTMLRQVTAWLEREQQQPERTAMNQPRLPVSALGRVRFGMKGTSEIRKIERHRWSRQSRARMRPQPLVWTIHATPFVGYCTTTTPDIPDVLPAASTDPWLAQ
jgi:hypothetical protein